MYRQTTEKKDTLAFFLASGEVDSVKNRWIFKSVFAPFIVILLVQEGQ